MEKIQIRNPVYSAPNKSTIDCEIDHPVYGWIPFTASPQDVEAHGRELFAMLAEGQAGPVADYVPPPEPVTQKETPKPEGNGEAA